MSYHVLRSESMDALTILFYYNERALATPNDVMVQQLPRAYCVMSDRVMFLMQLSVPDELQHQGIGSRLLQLVAAQARLEGCRRIDVDDMSLRFRALNNIYKKHGFRYRRDTGPEMYASPADVISRAALIHGG